MSSDPIALTIGRLEALRNLGIQLAVDDFEAAVGDAVSVAVACIRVGEAELGQDEDAVRALDRLADSTIARVSSDR